MLRRKGNHATPSSGSNPHHPSNDKGSKSHLSSSSSSSFLSIRSMASHALVAFMMYAFLTSSNSMSASCPTDVVGFLNWASSGVKATSSSLSSLKRVQPPTPHPPKMTPVPNQYRKTFYYDGSKLSMPIARAFRSRGWQLVDDTENAHVIYTYSNHADWAQELQPWQRFNYIPGYKKWNKKDEFAYYYKVWEHEHPERPKSVYVPETYLLTESEQEIRAFQKVLNEGGSKYPWVHKQANVNQGKGITILAPESKQLLALPSLHLKLLHDKRDHSKDDDDDQVIIQRYVCNEMTWNKRKFDVRMYWLVASLDPLVVLYHDGYVRIGNSEYSEEDFRDTTSHLTTHTGLGAEGKATMKEFEAALEALYRRNTGHLQRRWPRRRDDGNMTPMEHVRNQFKHALGEMAEVFLTESFNKPDFKDITSENGFNFYCADYILDNDLDVFFIEPQNGCGLDEDYYFRLEMHASLFNGMVDVLEEISQKQEAGLPVLPLEKLGNWEIIYADGMVYHYEGYERSKNKASCTTN